MQFKIEQIALFTNKSADAIQLLTAIGLTDWVHDHVVANGYVHGVFGQNEADLDFNYQATGEKNLELEILNYTKGNHWMSAVPGVPTVSHLGMHVTPTELLSWKKLLGEMGYAIAQTVMTESHTNSHIANSRRYNYVIFDTRKVIGVDLKFIVRYVADPE